MAETIAVGYLSPVLAFLVVFVVLFAILMKTKLLGDEKLIQILVSFVVASIFVVSDNLRSFVLEIVPWFAVLLMLLFFILIFVNFLGKGEIAGKGIGWVFIVLMFFVFIGVGFKIFAGGFAPYLPGYFYGYEGNPALLGFTDWLYSPRIAGAIILLVVGGIVSWFLVKKG
ncbi:MAG: hypothetical protein Q8P57_01310 [Candidatus Pacearchaeota archaeon]|nr:hypothetical protein [Candidatus Pacearchaeota archaeon]